MYPSPDINSDLLARYIAGEADAEQRALVERWAAEAPENARELERFRSVWSLSDVPVQVGDVDVDAAWRKVNAQIGGAKVIPLTTRKPSVWVWMAAAAALVGVLLVGRLLLAPAQQELMADTAFRSARLGDSSQVVLSPGSRLVATMGKERSVELEGQAYFEVQRDEQRPFLVHTAEVDVTVLGTAFEVTAYESNDTVRVRVRHGKVGVRSTDGDSLVLTAGQEARWVRGKHLLERGLTGPVERWADRILQFSNAPLQRVVEELNVLYDVRIELGSEAIAACPLTAAFGDEPIDEIVRVIAGTFGLDVTRSAEGILTLTGDGC